MKRMALCILAVLLVLCSCTMQQGNTPDAATESGSTDATDSKDTKESCYSDPEETGNFSSAAFFDIQEGDAPLSDAQLRSVISLIPDHVYEAYPETHGAPLTATLYKNGETYEIDENDPRLVMLTNFFNNCVYYGKCHYTLNYLSIDYLEKEGSGADFRLELTYTPYGDSGPGAYEKSTSRCDTIIVTNTHAGVILIAHDLPGYEWDRENYPFRAAGYLPLYDTYPLLELFGF